MFLRRIVLFILLLAVLTGCNRHEEIRQPKRIICLYSFTKGFIGTDPISPMLKKKLAQKGINATIDNIYLDCERYGRNDEINRIKVLLDSLGRIHHYDLIIVHSDQASYSILCTNHPILDTVPTVLLNVRYPDQQLLKQNAQRPIYCLTDKPDFIHNAKFIEQIFGQSVQICINFDWTALGRIAFKHLEDETAQSHYYLLLRRPYLSETMPPAYNVIKQQYDSLYRIRPAKLKNTTYFLCDPLRYIGGYHLFRGFAETASSHTQAFLHDKLDIASEGFCNYYPSPTFTCVNEGFGQKYRVVGGYFASLESSLNKVAELGTQLMRGARPRIKNISLNKQYWIDWKFFSTFSYLKDERIPKEAHIINYPWYLKHLGLVIAYSITIFLLLAWIIYNWIKMRINNKRQEENIRLLEQGHYKLSMAIRGSHTSAWSYEDGKLYFDDNLGDIIPGWNQTISIEHIIGMVHPDDRKKFIDFVQSINPNKRKKETQVLQIRIRPNKEAPFRWIEMRYCSLTDAHGLKIIAGLLQDIQAFKQREEELIKARDLAEQNELKQSFLANMSHEIRTPLNAIVGYSNLLVSEGDAFSDEEKKEFINNINTNNSLLLKLVNDVLELSRLESGKTTFYFESCNVNELLHELYTTHKLIIKKTLDFKLSLLDEQVYVRIDKLRLMQVIINFLGNANKFTEHGYIELGWEWQQKKKIIVLYVKDTGKGISTDEQKMIFDRFYKSDEFVQGTGLGLAICDTIVRKMGGHIELRSEVGKGSCFAVLLDVDFKENNTTNQ